MKIKILLSSLIVIIFAVGGRIAFVFAETTNTSDEIRQINAEINSRKDKIKQLEDTIAKYNANINAKQTEAVSLKNQLGILDKRIKNINDEIDLNNEKIFQTNLQIQSLSLSIADKESTIEKQKVVIKQLVQNINAENQKNYIEIIASYKNFADFYNEIKYLENFYSDLGQSVTSLRLAKEDLNAKHNEQAVIKESLEELKIQLEQKKEDLSEQTSYKQKVLTQTKANENKFRILLASLKQQYQVIENEQRTYEARLRKKLEEQDKIKMGSDVIFSWPVESRYITAEFHDPDYPYRNIFEHSGIDLRASFGTPVRAAAAGYVGRARRCTTASCYAYVLIIHTGNLSSVYGHLSNIIVNDDQFVNRGDVIGYSGGRPGSIGAGPFVTGPHLHFEARLNGIPINPHPYLP